MERADNLRSNSSPMRRGGNPLAPLFFIVVLVGAILIAGLLWLGQLDAPSGPDRRQAEAEQSDPQTTEWKRVSPSDSDEKTRPAERAPARTVKPPAPENQDKKSETLAPKAPPKARGGGSETEASPMGEADIAMRSAHAMLKRGDYAGALPILAKYAGAGRADAQSALGLLYAAGKGVDIDLDLALDLFRNSAMQGDANGQFYLAHAYLSGTGIKKDRNEALAWFIHAAARHHVHAIKQRDAIMAALDENGRFSAVNRAKQLGPIIPAGWSRDPETGTAVWLPSWFRRGTYRLKLEVAADQGLAHGEGRAILTASLPGESDRTFEGRFHHGHFVGTGLVKYRYEMLPTDSYLVRLPDSTSGSFHQVAFWLINEFGVRIAVNACDIPTNRRAHLVTIVPAGFAVLDNASVTDLIRENWRIYRYFCPSNKYADLTIAAQVHERVIERGDTEFRPALVEAYLHHKDDGSVGVGQYRNHALASHQRKVREAEKARKADIRRQEKAASRQAALARGRPDIRGIRIGMTLAEVRALFMGEIDQWQPAWKPDREYPPYQPFVQRFRLTDGAKVEATFTSPISGSVLFAFSYEQKLLKGPTWSELSGRLKDKYGEPDNRRGGAWRYKLISQSGNQQRSAIMQIHFQTKGDDQNVTRLEIAVNDFGLGESDKKSARGARQQAKRERFEAGKSERVRF